MLKKEFVINCKEGFHLRPAQVMMETLTPFAATILLRKAEDGEEADAKSILGLMSLGLEHGEKVSVEADGPDEAAAMKAVEELFAGNFGEDPAA